MGRVSVNSREQARPAHEPGDEFVPFVPGVSDAELHARLAAHPDEGWRLFVDTYTPFLVAVIGRAGVDERDDVGEIYVTLCERLVANQCARLRAHDPQKGALAAWLTTLTRHAVVDWVRSRAGRRRLFAVVKRLDQFDQNVFSLYYWEGRTASEIAEMLRARESRPVSTTDVLESLARLDASLSDRHRRQLAALVSRGRTPVSLERTPASSVVNARAGAENDPELRLRVRAIDEAMRTALAELPAEDAAIVRLLFVQGWTRQTVARALHLSELPAARVQEILRALRDKASRRALTPGDAAMPGLTFLEDGRP